jgi:sugar lactone lactonase YvrE
VHIAKAALAAVALCGGSLLPSFTASASQDLPAGTYVVTTNFAQGTISEKSPTGVVTSVGQTWNSPTALATDNNGDVYVVANTADGTASIVVKVARDGTQTSFPVPGSATQPTAIAVDASGNSYVTDASNNWVVKIDPHGLSTVVISGLDAPTGVAVDGVGNLYVSHAQGATVLKVAPDGTRTSVGQDLVWPSGVAVDAVGNVFISDYTCKEVVKVAPDQSQTRFSTGSLSPDSIALDTAGNIYVASTDVSEIAKLDGHGGLTLLGSGDAVATWTATPPTISATLPPPNAEANSFYSFPFQLGGAPAPVATLTAGNVPYGMTLSPSGILYGIPTIVGEYTFTVTATNGVGSASLSAELAVTSKELPGAPTIDSLSTTDGQVVGRSSVSESAAATKASSATHRGTAGALARTGSDMGSFLPALFILLVGVSALTLGGIVGRRGLRKRSSQ